jgi:hypothetical protein
MYDPKGELTPYSDPQKAISDKLKFQMADNIPRPIFEKGKVIRIEGAPFRIESIGSHLITLRPLPWDGGEDES